MCRRIVRRLPRLARQALREPLVPWRLLGRTALHQSNLLEHIELEYRFRAEHKSYSSKSENRSAGAMRPT